MKLSWENMTLGQYQTLIKEAEELTEDRIWEIMVGKNKKDLTLKEISEIEIGDINLPQNPIIQKFFYLDGVLHGPIDPAQMSFGEYIDLLGKADNLGDNLISALTIMFRPVKKISRWNKLKLWATTVLFKSKSAKAITFQDLIKSQLIPYDSDECKSREEAFKGISAQYGGWAILFFTLTLTNLYRDFLSYSLEQKLIQLQDSRELQKKTLAGGDGSPTSGRSATKTSPKSKKSSK